MAPGFKLSAMLGLFPVGIASNKDAVVKLPFGEVRGLALQEHREFLGIPYATAKRFEAPQPWQETFPSAGLDGTALSPQCWQAGCTAGTCSESCLVLNIYARLEAAPATPVMLWIHGGSLETGSANFYNGSKLAVKHNVTMVAMNYRLNVFGFSAVPKADGSVLANLGYRDQREAMQWVRKHIAAFGGDSKRVTIFGESAGGQSVLAHVLSPGSAGLFDAAISESGDVTLVEPDIGAKQKSFADIGASLSCTDSHTLLPCLENLNPEKIFAAYSAQVEAPVPAVVDGDIYPAAPAQLARQGTFNRVPLIMGSNANEGNLFFPASSRPASSEDVACVFELAFGEEKAQELLDMYSPTESSTWDNRDKLSEVFSDLLYHCVDRDLARSLTKHGSAPWIYKFKRAPACSTSPGVPGAYHSSEIPFVLDFVQEEADISGCKSTKAEQRLGARMAGLWASFASSLTADVEWEPYSLPSEPSLTLDLGSLSRLDHEQGYRRAQCDLIDTLLPKDGTVDGFGVGALITGLSICQEKNARIQV